MNPQVLIAGAGPVGLTLAIELARYGVSVRIVDKAPARTDKSKAVAVWARSLELFERAGIAGALVAAGVRVNSANISDGTKNIAHITFDGLDTRYSFVLMIPQSETERILEEKLAELGVKVERSVELKSFSDKGASVEALVARPDGSSRNDLRRLACRLRRRSQHGAPHAGQGIPRQFGRHGLSAGRHKAARRDGRRRIVDVVAPRRHCRVFPAARRSNSPYRQHRGIDRPCDRADAG